MIMSASELLLLLVYSLGFIAFLTVLEVLRRKFELQSFISRRVAHVGAGLFSLVMWATFSEAAFITANILLIAVISFSQWQDVFKAVHNVGRKTYGEVYLPLGILATYLMASEEPDIFIPAILIMTFSDVIAGIISDLRRKGKPSRAGSIGFFVMSFIILSYFGLSVAHTLSLAFVLMSVETVSPYGSDNFTVPIAAAILLAL